MLKKLITIFKDKNTNIFILSLFLSYILLFSSEVLGVFGLWASLIVLVLASLYFSVTFYSNKGEFGKLYYFGAILLFIIGYFALVYYSFGIIDTSTNEIIKKDWLNSIYFSVVTWTTVGYGDYKPTPYMKPWVMVEALLGYVFMALLVGKFIYYASKKKNK